MKRIVTILGFSLIIIQGVLGQTPLGFTYQAVVRNAEGSVRSNEMIALHVRILSGSASGTVVFEEPHAPITNSMGLFSVIIGSRNPVDFKNITWLQGPYFLQIYIDNVEMGTTELVSVPYAILSKTAEYALAIHYSSIVDVPNWNDSIQFLVQDELLVMQNELLQKVHKNEVYTKFQTDSILQELETDSYSNAQIDSLLLDLSTSQNDSLNELKDMIDTKADVSSVYTKEDTDAGLATKADVSSVYTIAEVDDLLVEKVSFAAIYLKSDIDEFLGAKADTSEVYSRTFIHARLAEKSSISDMAPVAFSGDYNDLANKPVIPILVSAFINDAGYITIDDMITEPEIIAMVTNNGFLQTESDPLFISSTAHGITAADTIYWNAKSEFDGEYTSLTGTPDLSVYALSTTVYTRTFLDAALALKLNTADVAPVALSGNYTDLLNRPTIPVLVSQLVNDAGYVTTDRVLSEAEVVEMVQNNGFISNETDPLFTSSPASLITLSNINSWNNKSDFDGQYSSLTGTPNLALYALTSTVYSKTEVDAALAEKANTAGLGAVAISNDYFDLENRPTIPTFTNQLTNNSGFLTLDDLLDNDPTNEIQILTLVGNTLTISHAGGNSVVFEGWDTDASNDVTLDDNQTITGNKIFEGKVEVRTPIDLQDAANKAYVDALETQIETLKESKSTLEQQIAIMNTILLQAGYNGTVKDLDGNVYKTLRIGNQVWMTENLRTSRYNTGTEIIFPGANNTLWANNTEGAFAWYNNDEHNAALYGGLYNWYAVNNEDICPEGWKVPTDADWQILETYLGMTDAANTEERGTDEGLQLKATNLWAVDGFEEPGTNSSGFTALPGGSRAGASGNYSNLSFYGFFWTATENGTNAWMRSLDYSSGTVYRNFYSKNEGYSIRCIQE